MGKNTLSRLEEVDLKEFWKHEERDFTPWLAEEENIALLGDVIGMELEVVSKEESVGSYRADILCKDTANGHFVVVENQLEQTDHKHLGQIITYGTGLNASSCIWIAKSFTEEHRAAIDWLNSISDDEHNFFAIEVKLYKIGDSPLAPIFNVVAKPNDWSKSVKKDATNTPTPIKLLQQEYWSEFGNYVSKQPKSNFKTQKAQPQHWSNISIGNSVTQISLSVDSRSKIIRVTLDIKGISPKENFEKLHNNLYDTGVSMFGDALIWDRLDNRKQSYVSICTDADFTDKTDWNNQFEWLFDNVQKFVDLFRPAVKGLK